MRVLFISGLLLSSLAGQAAIQTTMLCSPAVPNQKESRAGEIYISAKVIQDDSGHILGYIDELLASNVEGELENLLNSVWGNDPKIMLDSIGATSEFRFIYDGTDPKLHAIAMKLDGDIQKAKGERLLGSATLVSTGAPLVVNVACDTVSSTGKYP